MEILELIFGGLQLCDCFVGLLGLTSATGGAVEARRGKANRVERRQAKRGGGNPPPVSHHNWIAVALILFAIVLFAILAIARVASRR